MPRTENKQNVVRAYRRALERRRQIGFDALSDTEKELVAALLMHEEIRNGGFIQWLTNPESDRAADAIRFLRKVGDHERLRLIELAAAIFPSGRIPIKWEERRRIASTWSEEEFLKLDEFDRAYYAITHDIYNHLIALIPNE